MSESFNVGDLVCVCGTKRNRLMGLTGCVKNFKDNKIGIDFSENVDGNNLNGHCKETHGLYFGDREIREYGIMKMEPIDVVLKKQWKKEWEPKLNKNNLDEPVIILEE